MGIIKFTQGTNAVELERKERTELAEERQNAEESVEFTAIRHNMSALRQLEKTESLRKHGVGLDCEMEVGFGEGFNDDKSYTSLAELEGEESKNTSLSDLTKEELVARGFIC